MAVSRTNTSAPDRKKGSDSGQAILEFAIMLVALVMVAFVVIDLSRAIYAVEVITNLTGEGAKLASRGTTLSDTATAVMAGSSPVNLSTRGCVIVTAITNDGSAVKVSGQVSQGGITATSRIGTVGHPATLPSGAMPLANQTVYATEVFYSYSPVTPIGNFLAGVLLPSQLYDVAYF